MSAANFGGLIGTGASISANAHTPPFGHRSSFTTMATYFKNPTFLHRPRPGALAPASLGSAGLPLDGKLVSATLPWSSSASSLGTSRPNTTTPSRNSSVQSRQSTISESTPGRAAPLPSITSCYSALESDDRGKKCVVGKWRCWGHGRNCIALRKRDMGGDTKNRGGRKKLIICISGI